MNATTQLLLGVGNIYVETNYLGLNSGGSDVLQSGREYRAETYETRLGGSVMNFIVQSKILGATVGLIGKIGADAAGDKLVELLTAWGISSDYIVRSPDVQTSVDTGVVFRHSRQNIQLVAGNANQSLCLKDIESVLRNIPGNSAVYFGGFLKQESLYRDYPALLKRLKEKETTIFFDHGRIPVDMTEEKRSVLNQTFSFVDGYFPNEEEILGVTQQPTLDRAFEHILKLGPKLIVVKRGSKGCRIKTATADISIPGFHVQVINVVGAGDAFNAGFITQYFSGKSLPECGRFANAVAALRVSNNTQPSNQEVEEFIRNIRW